jgi:hypothetical protein
MTVSIVELLVMLACILTLCGIEAVLLLIIQRQRKENRELEARNRGQAQTLLHVTNQLMAAESRGKQ